MRESSADQRRKKVWIVVILQILITVAAGALFLIFGGAKAGYSAVSGGMAGVLANIVVIGIMFSGWGAASPKRARKAFVFGEVIKVIVTMAVLLIAVVWVKVDVLPLIIAYALTHLSFWLALLFALVPPVSKER